MSTLQALALVKPLEKQLARRLQQRGDAELAAAPACSPGVPLVLVWVCIPSQHDRLCFEAAKVHLTPCLACPQC